MAKDSPILISALMCGLIALCLALAGFLPISYNDLEDLPELLEIEDIPNIDLQHGLCLWLPFDGNVLDKSGYDSSSLLSGGSYSSGVFDRSLRLNYSGYVNVSYSELFNFTASDGFSFSYWVKWVNPAPLGWQHIISRTEYSSIFNSILPSGGLRIGVVCTGGSVEHNNNTLLAMNQFYHVVVVFKTGVSMRCYVDGVLNYTKSAVGKGYPVSSSAPFYVGFADGIRYFNGTIDDMRIYNRVLSDYEILHLYNLGV